VIKPELFLDLVATRPVDFRKGAHGLAAVAPEVLGEDPYSGAVLAEKRDPELRRLLATASRGAPPVRAAMQSCIDRRGQRGTA
jgi:hypothetical protein